MRIRYLISTMLSVFLAAGIAAADIESAIERQFAVKDGGLLTIDSDLGSIEVTAGASDKVVLTVHQTVDAHSPSTADKYLRDLKLDFNQAGNTVTVTARYKHDSWLKWNQRRIKLRFVAQVPALFNVDLKTAGGSISVADLQGEVISKTSGGSLKFGQITGPVSGKTSGGSITLAGCKGNAVLSTSGGSINVGRVEGEVQAKTSGGSITIEKSKGSVTASTSGGGIKVEEVYGDIDAATSGGSVSATIQEQPAAPCRLSTSGGSVNVTLAPHIKVDVDASTSGGRVRTDFEMSVQGEISRSHLTGKINGGGPLLRLRTSGGNINIHKTASH